MMSRSGSRSRARAGALLLGMVLAVGCQAGRPAAGPAPAASDSVNVGYGTLERKQITGAVQSLTADEIARTRVARVEELFNGRFAGVHLVRTRGGLAVRIRGNSTLLGNGDPLFVVDGMPVSSTAALAGLNPADIARIEVLKDAGTTAIYGSRSANGVVLITTKRAR